MVQIDIMTPLVFTVRRRAPELVVPASPTPRELKLLSDIDDTQGGRFQIPSILIYRGDQNMGNKNPASVIKEALAKLLVFYYPFAGRLKEGPKKRLMVDCSGEGVLFIEAEADVTLEQFGYPLLPPFPCMDELLYDVPGSSGILDSPLLLIQVTRLLCGGFVFALRLNHTMSDAKGITQFKTALGEIARGASTPSILPVWQRDLLFARDPPRVTCTHHAFDEVVDTRDNIIPQDHAFDEVVDTRDNIIPQDDIANRLFFFGPDEISTIRQLVPTHLKNCSTFDVLTACLWRCRTIALQPNPKDDMRMVFIVDVRAKLKSFIPVGFYGNAIATAAAICTAEDLTNKPLGYALKLVMKAKFEVSEEYIRSQADLMVIKNRPHFTVVRSYVVSDLTRLGMDIVDFGWGKASYGGPVLGGAAFYSNYIRFVNNIGESGIAVRIYLPNAAMEKFEGELKSILVQDNEDHKLPALSKL